jgi:hypothetical protein
MLRDGRRRDLEEFGELAHPERTPLLEQFDDPYAGFNTQYLEKFSLFILVHVTIRFSCH